MGRGGFWVGVLLTNACDEISETQKHAHIRQWALLNTGDIILSWRRAASKNHDEEKQKAFDWFATKSELSICTIST
jgi:hypothetical protein